MPRYKAFTIAFILATLVPVFQVFAYQTNKDVVVTGIAEIVDNRISTAREEAIQKARREAIEQTLGFLIENEFSAEQQEVLRAGQKEGEFSSSVKDKVLTKSSGFIKRQRILGEKRVGTAYRVTLRVTVSEKSLHQELASLDDLLQALGNPKVMVLAGEIFTAQNGPVSWVRPSTTEPLLQEGLLKHNIELVAQEQTAGAAMASAASFQGLVQNPSQAASMASQAGADVTIISNTQSRFASHNDMGANMYYVVATVNLIAVKGGTGQMLASFSRTGRGVGIDVVDARQNAVKQVAPEVIDTLLTSLVNAWKKELQKSLVHIASKHKLATIGIKDQKQEFYLVDPNKTFAFEVQGPQNVEIAFRILSKRPSRQPVEAKIEMARDAVFLTTWSVKAPIPKRAKVETTGEYASKPMQKHMAVPEGSHLFVMQYEISAPGSLAINAMRIKTADNSKLLPKEEKSAMTIAWAVPPKMKAQVLAPAKAAPTAPSPTPAPPPPEIAKPTPAKAAPSASSAPVQVGSADGTVAGATRALAQAVADGFAQSGKTSLFHRVAVPYFESVGDAAKQENLGRIVSELLSVELAGREPFVVVERERLGQIMREHRLKGLGLVSPDSAAQLGQVLGAQSIISGTVSETGPQFIVTVRQVDVTTGQVLVAGSVGIQRDGLIALSSDLVVKRSVMGAVFRSAMVPGWGQIYNEDTIKGMALAGAGLGALATAATYTFLRLQTGSKYDSAKEGVVRPSRLEKLRDQGDKEAERASIGWIAYGVVWAVGIVDALLNGEDYEAFQAEQAAVHIGTAN